MADPIKRARQLRKDILKYEDQIKAAGKWTIPKHFTEHQKKQVEEQRKAKIAQIGKRLNAARAELKKIRGY